MPCLRVDRLNRAAPQPKSTISVAVKESGLKSALRSAFLKNAYNLRTSLPIGVFTLGSTPAIVASSKK